MIQKLVKKLRKSRSGFTLIELIVVIAILAILAAVLIPTVGGYIGSARASAAQSDSRSVYTAAATIVASNTTTTYSAGNIYDTGDTATAGKIVNSDLTPYLGSGFSNKFTIEQITIDNTGTITAVEILENGKYYKWTPNASGSSQFTSSSTSIA